MKNRSFGLKWFRRACFALCCCGLVGFFLSATFDSLSPWFTSVSAVLMTALAMVVCLSLYVYGDSQPGKPKNRGSSGS